ncbi:MAG: response regulator [Planctomycetota bacterium]|jgi:CheY-like chemotaxis protein|nr:response regulator [Planctomycetota bacterium]
MSANSGRISARHCQTLARRRNIPPGVKPMSIFEEASREAFRHKWIESEKTGYDIGDVAIEDWHRRFWHKFVRERWIQHIRGQAFWRELDNDDYGFFNHTFADCLKLAESIVGKLEAGGENLDIIQWAVDSGQNMEMVLSILARLDLNSHRLSSQLDFTGSEFAKNIRVRHKPKSLVVDDDPDARELLRAILEHENLEVVEAVTGEEAMDVVQSRRFDLFILDLRLPRRHGAEIAYYLRRHGVHRFIVAIGSSLDEWHECDLYDCGFTHLLRKPFPLERMTEIARDVLQSLPASDARSGRFRPEPG